jgi:hypothetical protein
MPHCHTTFREESSAWLSSAACQEKLEGQPSEGPKRIPWTAVSRIPSRLKNPLKHRRVIFVVREAESPRPE